MISATTPDLRGLTIAQPVAEQIGRCGGNAADVAQKLIEWWENQRKLLACRHLLAKQEMLPKGWGGGESSGAKVSGTVASALSVGAGPNQGERRVGQSRANPARA